jgi:hypothetical protein
MTNDTNGGESEMIDLPSIKQMLTDHADLMGRSPSLSQYAHHRQFESACDTWRSAVNYSRKILAQQVPALLAAAEDNKRLREALTQLVAWKDPAVVCAPELGGLHMAMERAAALKENASE